VEYKKSLVVLHSVITVKNLITLKWNINFLKAGDAMYLHLLLLNFFFILVIYLICTMMHGLTNLKKK